MNRVTVARKQTPLMRAFVLCMLLQAALLVVLVVGVWKYTADILDREAELTSYVLPNLELAHRFTSATAGIQSQGLLLRTADTREDLTLRKRMLEESIRETKELIETRSMLSAFDTDRLAETIDQMQDVVIGLSDVRGTQLANRARLAQTSAERIAEMDALLKLVQDRVVVLTDKLLETREVLSEYAEDDSEPALSQSDDTASYDSALDRFEANSLIIQDYLLFSQDLIGLKSVLERLPLIIGREQIVLAEQTRDLLIQAMVSRAVYISDQAGGDLLLTPLTRIRQALRGENNVFARRLSALDTDTLQQDLSAQLAQLTIDVPAVIEQIRLESESILLKVAAATRQGLERYRWFLFFALILSMLVLGSIGYWLLYRRTVLPLGELASRLDDVGTPQFAQPDQAYFIREIEVLSQVLGELDRTQKQMQRKDIELNVINNDLRKANEDLEQFVHVASHDLQEPLRKLQQFSGLLAEDYRGKFDEDGEFYLEAVANSARRMSNMIKDTLAYARSARDEQSDDQVDLNELVRKVYEDIEITVAETAAHVRVDELPIVMANRIGMFQLFSNLLINAIKYRRDDVACEVAIRTRQPADRDGLVIEVKDNGIGIEERFFDKIFVPFERLASQSVSGTGLGLAICAKVCNAHGWHISVSSETGQGSCFQIAIPGKDIVKAVAE